jgi:hypothetical protein
LHKKLLAFKLSKWSKFCLSISWKHLVLPLVVSIQGEKHGGHRAFQAEDKAKARSPKDEEQGKVIATILVWMEGGEQG